MFDSQENKDKKIDRSQKALKDISKRKLKNKAKK